MMAESTSTTVAYKKLRDLSLYIDVYPPTPKPDGPVPAVVYFHGGGMTVGDRASWFPIWLHSPFFPSRIFMHITLTRTWDSNLQSVWLQRASQ